MKCLSPVVLLVWCCSVLASHASELVLLGSAKQTVQLERLELSDNQQEAYGNFVKRAEFLGAFAVSPTGKSWGSQVSSNLQHSRAAAVGRCNQHAPAKDCRVIALTLPAGMNPTAPQATALTPSQQEYIKKQYLKSSVQNARKYAALAGNSFYVVARYGRSYRERAISVALSDCRRYTSRLKGSLGLETYTMLQSTGALECRILHVTEKK